mgnify:CR=1 FL=1
MAQRRRHRSNSRHHRLRGGTARPVRPDGRVRSRPTGHGEPAPRAAPHGALAGVLRPTAGRMERKADRSSGL